MFSILRRVLRYPHKLTSLRYIFRHPEMLEGLASQRAPGHLFRSIQRFSDKDLLSAIHLFMPESFLQAMEKNAWFDGHGYRIMLYLLVRQHKPEVVVETGVSRGLSSAYVLQAMRDNGFGKLISVDLPPDEAKVEESQDGSRIKLGDGQTHGRYEVGYLVPDYLRDQWELHLGDARELLPGVIEAQDQIDFFYHDSLHTYDHMMFEYETAWPKLKPGGLLISDDITWNMAYAEFCKRHNMKPKVFRTFGCAVKPGG